MKSHETSTQYTWGWTDLCLNILDFPGIHTGWCRTIEHLGSKVSRKTYIRTELPTFWSFFTWGAYKITTYHALKSKYFIHTTTTSISIDTGAGIGVNNKTASKMPPCSLVSFTDVLEECALFAFRLEKNQPKPHYTEPNHTEKCFLTAKLVGNYNCCSCQ